MTMAMRRLPLNRHIRAIQFTIYYAFKQADTDSEVRALHPQAGKLFLEAVLIQALDFSVVGTWPMRTENRSRPNELANAS